MSIFISVKEKAKLIMEVEKSAAQREELTEEVSIFLLFSYVFYFYRQIVFFYNSVYLCLW